MRPRLVTPRNFLLLLSALVIFGGLAWWGSLGFPLPGQAVPSTAGKLVYALEKDGKGELYWLDGSSGDGGVALTTGAGRASEPQFSPDGRLLAFTTERAGIRQVTLMEAAPGRRVVGLTRTTTTKEQPLFSPEGRLYFLDGGKLSSVQTDGSDARAVFPSADLKKVFESRGDGMGFFEEGGVARFVISPGGKQFLLVVNRESGQAVYLYEPEQEALIHLGMAKRVLPVFLKEGGFVVVYSGGAPAGKPNLVMAKEALEQPGFMVPAPPALPETLASRHVMVRYSPRLEVEGAISLPGPTREVAIAPDDRRVIFATDGGGWGKGLALMVMGGQQTDGAQLHSGEVSDISFSPDGNRVSFASGGDIYSVRADGSEPAKKLTDGSGKASKPAWSPAPREGQK